MGSTNASTRKKSGKVYAIVPMINEKEIHKLETRDLDSALKKFKKLIETVNRKDFLAIEYPRALVLKFQPNVPHDFIGMVGDGESTPLLSSF